MNTYFAFNVICAIVAIGACMYAALKNDEAKEAQEAAEHFEKVHVKSKAFRDSMISSLERRLKEANKKTGDQEEYIKTLEVSLKNANEEMKKLPKYRKRDAKGRFVKA